MVGPRPGCLGGAVSEMTMNRVIHGAVRRDLERLERALASARDGDVSRARGLRDAYAFLQGQLTHHHEQEDALIFPTLGGLGVDADLLEDMESEHEAMAQALAATRTAMDRYAESGARSDAEAAQAEVGRARRVVDEHLDHEERELEPLMLAHSESEEWRVTERRLRKQPPKVAGTFFAWVEDGMEPEQRAYYESAVPAPVRLLLGRGFGRAYRRDVARVWR